MALRCRSASGDLLMLATCILDYPRSVFHSSHRVAGRQVVFCLLGGTILWQADHHALRKLRDVPPTNNPGLANLFQPAVVEALALLHSLGECRAVGHGDEHGVLIGLKLQ
jgi:hypothetical protein